MIHRALSVLILFAFQIVVPVLGEVERSLVVCFGDSITKRGYPAVMGEMLDVEVVKPLSGKVTSR